MTSVTMNLSDMVNLSAPRLIYVFLSKPGLQSPSIVNAVINKTASICKPMKGRLAQLSSISRGMTREARCLA